jgi:heterodisulfide reductase subunit D
MNFETIFWAIHLPLMALFLVGLGDLVHIWLQGRVVGEGNPSAGRKFLILLGRGLRAIFSRRLPVILRNFIVEAWFNRRLWVVSRWRWLSHFLLLNGFLLLMVMSGIAAVADKILHRLFGLGGVPWIAMWYTPDHPVTALLNEIGAVMMTAGLLFYIVRRYITRPAQLRTGSMDTWLVVGLGLILLSGWITEIARLNAGYNGTAPYLAFIGYPLSLLVAGWNLPWEELSEWMFLVHGLWTSVVIVTIPYSKFIHAAAAPLLETFEGVRQEPAAVAKEGRPFTFWQMVALDACTRCGECTLWCPTFTEKPELDAITPLRKIEAVRRFTHRELGLIPRLIGGDGGSGQALQTHSAGTYDCTLCGRCAVVCTAHIPTRELWIAMRQELVAKDVYPEAFDALRERVLGCHNISGDDNNSRLIWSENLPEIPAALRGKTQAEVVFFVGCVSSFYPQCYSIPQSLVQVMEGAGVDYMALGGEEWCCGFPLVIAGMGDAAVEVMRHNLEAVRKTGARFLVATCPSCYHTWEHDYPRILGEPLGFEVLHATEFVARLLHEGRLRLQPLEEVVTYHDPCDLGRTSGIYEAPREIIRAIPGITFVEMEHHHEYSLCCGGGGDVEMADKSLTEKVARRRIQEAQATQAKLLLSSCQQCKRTLAGAARQEKVRIRVLDVVELVAQQIQPASDS